MPPTMTFFASEYGKHQQAIEPIAETAAERGFDVEFVTEGYKETDIGVFTSSASLHHPAVHTDLSAVMFHGIDSAYSSGARRWNWSRFDVGLLPGPAAATRWQEDATHPAARPKQGAFDVGWPKSDRIFRDEFSREVASYREALEMDHERTVLYAPSFESHGNLRNFCEQLSDVPCTLLVKHGSYDTAEFTEESIQSLYAECRELDSVEILDTDDNILYPLAISDIVVTDSLSVCLESLLTETVSVAVSDWKNHSDEFWASGMPEFVTRLDSHELVNFVTSADVNSLLADLQCHRDNHFSNLGTGAEAVVDLLDCAYNGRDLPYQALTPESGGFKSTSQVPRNTIRNAYLYIIAQGRLGVSERQKRWLKRARIHKIIRYMNNLLERIQ